MSEDQGAIAAPMRSLLFVPADNDRKLARAMDAGADALILDLEDSVAPAAKPAARTKAAAFIRESAGGGPRLYVRINGLRSGLAEADLDAVVSAGLDGIMLPKAEGGPDIKLLSAMLAVREARTGLFDGATGIIAIASETPAALFEFGTYRNGGPRLAGLTWGAEDLSTALGAETSRDDAGGLTDPYRLARTLCLVAAAAAEIAAIDTVFTDFRDHAGLAREAEAARRDGFTGKLAIHPEQVPIINRAFTPSPEATAQAKAVIAAFKGGKDSGVVTLDGKMLDRPHLRRAQQILARARAAGLLDQG